MKHDTRIIDYSRFIQQASKALILLPREARACATAIEKLADFRALLSPIDISLFCGDISVAPIPDTMQHNCISMQDKDINLFGLPERHFLDTAFRQNFDLLIDLNPTFDLISTYISYKINATLRVCFYHKNREPYYNLQVRTDSLVLTDQLATMLKYLSQLFALSPLSPNTLPAA